MRIFNKSMFIILSFFLDKKIILIIAIHSPKRLLFCDNIFQLLIKLFILFISFFTTKLYHFKLY